MDFQAVARPHHIWGLPVERKMQILPPRPSSQVDTQAGSKNVPDRPRLTRSLLQRKQDGTDIWMLL